MPTFDEAAQNWDVAFRTERAKKIALAIRETYACELIRSPLEFGCGTGLISQNLQDFFPRITLVDSSQGMINAVQTKIQQANWQHMQAYCLDLLQGGTLPEAYDLIYSSLVLHHILDIDAALAVLYNTLAPNGHLCIVDLDVDDGLFHEHEPDFDGHHGFSHAALIQQVQAAQFTNVQCKTFYHGEKPYSQGLLPYTLFMLTAQKS